MAELEELVREAEQRLAWLRDEYGEDDIDYLTFAPVVQALRLTLDEVETDPLDTHRATGQK